MARDHTHSNREVRRLGSCYWLCGYKSGDEMSSAIYLSFEKPIPKEDFEKFCDKNNIIFSPNTIGGNVYYHGGHGGVQIVFGNKEITISTFHCSVGGKLEPVADIAKEILSEFDGSFECDPEFNYLMKEIYCHECSKAGGAERAIYHLPPACK